MFLVLNPHIEVSRITEGKNAQKFFAEVCATFTVGGGKVSESLQSQKPPGRSFSNRYGVPDPEGSRGAHEV